MAKKKKKSKKKKDDGILFTIDRTDTQRLICIEDEFKEKKYLTIRMQYLAEEDDEWRMTQKGVSIPFANGMADKFKKECRKAFRKKE